jgi:hypothetical protein
VPKCDEVSAPLLITPAEAARRLGLDQALKDPERAVREMARRGELRSVLVGRCTMIDPESVLRWVRARTQ